MQPRDVLGRVRIRYIRQNLCNDYGIGDSLKLWGCPKVPDRGNPSSVITDEIVLVGDGGRRVGAGECLDQILDGDIFSLRTVPEVEQIVLNGIQDPVVAAHKARYVENLADSASGTVTCLSVSRIHHTRRHVHKHVVCRTGIVLNTEPQSNCREWGSGEPKGGLLIGRKRNSGAGETAISGLCA